MKEVEGKILEINKEEMIAKLLELGAEKVFEGELVSNLYDFNDDSIKKSHTLLRLRKKGEKNILTFKKSLSKDKVKIEEEIETEVKDFDIVNKIFEEIGLRVRRAGKKKRTSYKLTDTRFEIDEPSEGIPTYLEIEAPDEETIFEYAKKLGIEKEKVLNWRGGEVLKHYGISYNNETSK